MFSLMGNCVSCVKKKNESRREVTLAILGLDNAGKSTTTKGLMGDTLNETTPTIGFNVEEIKFGNYDLKMYDLGGGKKIRDIWIKYFSEIYGIVYVVDSTASERMEETKDNLHNLLTHDKVSGKPVLLLANKQDKEDALDEVDICEQLNLENLVNKNKCPCRIETCSALKGTGKKMDKNIKSGLHWLCGVIDHNWTVYHRRVQEDVEEQDRVRKREMEERRERVRKIREERERKQQEENERLGIKQEEEDEDDMDIVQGGPFKRLDVGELTKKEKKLKEEKKKRKQLEKQQRKLSAEIDKEDHEAEELGDLRSTRSARMIDRFGLLNDNTNSPSMLPKSDDEDEEDYYSAPKNRQATPRLPPLQKPLGTRFNEDAPVQKAKKKKKRKPKLKALTENIEEPPEESDDQFTYSKKSLQSISKIQVDSLLSNNGISALENLENGVQRRDYKVENDDSETLEEVTPRSKKKRSKKRKKKEEATMNGYGHDLSTPRTLGNINNDSDDNDPSPRKSQGYDSDENQSEIRKLKKKKPKHFLKKNKTAPSDDEFEMNEREVSFSPMGSPSRKPGYTPRQESLSEMFSANTKWGLAEDLPDVETSYKPRLQRRSNVDEDDDLVY